MSLEEEHAARRAGNATLQRELSTRREQGERLTAALHAAQARIEELEAKQTPPPAFVKTTVPERPKPPRNKRAPEHTHARRWETPTQIVQHRLEHCPTCQGHVSGVHLARRRQVIDRPPPLPVQVMEHQVFRGGCSSGHAWREARLSLSGQVLGQGRIGVGLASLVAPLRVVVRAPIRVIQAWLARVHGLRLSVGEISDLLRRVAAAGLGAVAQVRERIRASPVVQADETGWRERGQNGYVWFAGTPTGEGDFEYPHSRAGALINTLLGEDLAGVLGSDCDAADTDTPGGRHQRCWAHLRRDVHALKTDHAPELAVVIWAKAVKAVSLLAQAWLEEGRDRQATYREAVLLIHALGEPFAQAKGHPSQALAKRLWRHEDEVVVFVRQPEVPTTTNLAERSLPPLVIARKISGGSRSDQGSQTRLTLTSLFQTWQAPRLNPLHECLRLLQSPFPQV